MSFWHELPRPFFILAPMEAVTDVVFRHVVKQAGAPDVFFTEFTNATGWAHAGDKAIGGRLIKTDDEEPIVAQLWGAVPEDIAMLAQYCKKLGFHGIDINMGCPDASAVKAGGGAGMIRTPQLATEIITAAKTGDLPVSVKTRLGYSTLDEWKQWLTHLLHQDIANLTIHLRTKKEMSKVPAHHELIPDILALRDEIAPETLITINGDIENTFQGRALEKKYPGIDGIMIGRGVFHDPFCFQPGGARPSTLLRNESEATAPPPKARLSARVTPARVVPGGAAPKILQPTDENFRGGPGDGTRGSDLRGNSEGISDDGSVVKKDTLIELLHLHLGLFDKWDTPEHPRKFDPLKRFFKIYVNSFEGAAELRDKLMHTKNTAEVRAVLSEHNFS